MRGGCLRPVDEEEVVGEKPPRLASNRLLLRGGHRKAILRELIVKCTSLLSDSSDLQSNKSALEVVLSNSRPEPVWSGRSPWTAKALFVYFFKCMSAFRLESETFNLRRGL